MPIEGTASKDIEIRLPWLQPLNAAQEGLPVALRDFTKISIKEGSQVYLDETLQRFRVTHPSGTIMAWERLAFVKIAPGESYSVQWRLLGNGDDPTINLYADGEVYLDQIEGKEHLFAEFTRLVLDPLINPAGMPLPDGAYHSSNHGASFELFFGRDGSRPRMVLPGAATGTQPNIPMKFVVSVKPGITVFDLESKTDIQPARDSYVADVFSWDPQSGEVFKIKFSWEFQLDQAEFVKHVAAGNMQITKIIEDRVANY